MRIPFCQTGWPVTNLPDWKRPSYRHPWNRLWAAAPENFPDSRGVYALRLAGGLHSQLTTTRWASAIEHFIITRAGNRVG